MKEFALDLRETRFMFSLQYQLVVSDISAKPFQNLKSAWLKEWKKSTELFLSNQSKAEIDNSQSELITEWSLVKQEAEKIKINKENRFKFYLILLEVTLFIPYYKLGTNKDDNFKDLKVVSEDRLISRLELIASTLEIDKECVKRFKSNYKEALNAISGKGFKTLLGALVGSVVLVVTVALFTPAIAYFLAPILAPGLSGAAAISAVLAALGGGAIAAGGFGMAGGFAVLVAGGAILGGGTGAGVGALFAQSPDTALTQAAKLEVVMKEIIFVQKDIRLAQEIIKEQRQATRDLEDKLDDLVLEKEKNQKEIENLKKAIEYLKKALERNQSLL